MSSLMKRILSGTAGIVGAATAGAQCGNVVDTCPPTLNATQCLCYTGNQVNISGATLFRAFFASPASTNDFVDVDGDGCFGFNPSPGPGCFPNVVDQLAPTDNFNNHWVVQYRGVGSVNGFNEFIEFQLCCDLPELTPTERSTINSELYWDGSNVVGSFPCRGTGDVDGDGIPNGINRATGLPRPDGTGTPIIPTSIDIGALDVPSLWAVQTPSGVPAWSRRPKEPGYGTNPRQSLALAGSCAVPGPRSYVLSVLSRPCTPRELNFNVADADGDTVFDTPLTFVAVVPISNRGTGHVTLTYSQMRHLWVTGRLPNGENIAAATRDAGSGTHNAWMNSLGIDPSFGVGDARGGETDSANRTNLGSCHRVTNCGSSSHIENGVQMRRMAIGYTGLSGDTAAAADAFVGNYEILNVINDVAGATQTVRPTVSAVLDNLNPETGYQIGGYFSFTTVGDPRVSSARSPDYDPLSPAFMANTHAADYIYNIIASIAAFNECSPIPCEQNVLSPGQYLADTFFLRQGLDAEQGLLDPMSFTPNSDLNQSLQNYIRASNNLGVAALPRDGVVTPAFGSRNEAGLVPNKGGGTYSYRGAAGNLLSVAQNTRLSIRNRIAGDFLYDGQRNCADIARMMQAMAVTLVSSAADYTEAGAPLAPVGADDPALPNTDVNGENTIIVDILGDLNGSGAFDPEDVRYAADGTALVGGVLNRQCGFESVDINWTATIAGRPAGNFFNTTCVRPGGAAAPYRAGASRFDVVGSSTGPARGDSPIGANGVVDEADYCYIWQNIGAWSDLDSAVELDLSADHNGDLVINSADAEALVTQAWGACLGDLNFSGAVGLEDLAVLLTNFGATINGYRNGDLNCDGRVDLTDLAMLLSRFGLSGC